MKKITLQISGMTCHSCAMLIENELEDKLKGGKVSVSFVSEKADVEYDEKKISEKEIIDTITKLGYGVRGVRK